MSKTVREITDERNHAVVNVGVRRYLSGIALGGRPSQGLEDIEGLENLDQVRAEYDGKWAAASSDPDTVARFVEETVGTSLEWEEQWGDASNWDIGDDD